MKIFHTSPNRIDAIKRRTTSEVDFSGCIFFSDDVYTMTQSNEIHIYSIALTEDDIIDAEDLEDVNIDGQEATAHLIEYATACDLDLDEDDALELLTGDSTAWDLFDGEEVAYLDWYVQGIQGRAAREMGFTACRSEDEQGTVYIVDAFQRDEILNYEGQEAA